MQHLLACLLPALCHPTLLSVKSDVNLNPAAGLELREPSPVLDYVAGCVAGSANITSG